MDGLLSVAPNCAQAVAIFPSIFRTFNCIVKRLAGSPKGSKLIPTCPTLTKVLLPSTRILIYIDGLLSVATSPSCCYLTFFHIPERSIALVKLAGSPKGLKLIPTCPTLTKVKVAHAFLYTLMDSLIAPNCAQALLSYLLPYSRTFNCTSKTTGWFTKRS
jgi:hypothetical protein